MQNVLKCKIFSGKEKFQKDYLVGIKEMNLFLEFFEEILKLLLNRPLQLITRLVFQKIKDSIIIQDILIY